MKVKLIGLLFTTLLCVGCQATKIESVSDYIVTHSTRAELQNQHARQERVNLYSEYLKEEGLTDLEMPYDLLQQEVYHRQADRNDKFIVSLYQVKEPIENPTWRDVHEGIITRQYTEVTSETPLPTTLKDNLNYGYHSIEMDGSHYILEVMYRDIDLTNWEETQLALASIKSEKVKTNESN